MLASCRIRRVVAQPAFFRAVLCRNFSVTSPDSVSDYDDFVSVRLVVALIRCDAADVVFHRQGKRSRTSRLPGVVRAR